MWVKLCSAEIGGTDHNRQERHAVHLRLVDVYASNVQDGRAEVDVGHQHLLATADISTAPCLWRHQPVFTKTNNTQGSVPGWSGWV